MSLESPVNLAGFGFQRIKQIGRGHYANAYLVKETATDQTFVSKCVSLTSLSEHDQKSAHQEVFLLQSLRHPSIVAYHSSFLIDATNTLVIVMEYCNGGDLRHQIIEKVDTNEHFGENQVMCWFSQILLALQYIHSEKVLHRDLKTSNIFLTSAMSDEFSLLKVGDFGISRILEGTADAAVTMVGTPYYMSPEVCRNEPYDWKSDVWSLGCVLYELCMLKHAFRSQSLAGLIYTIISDNYSPIPDFYSPDLNELIRQMLTKSADSRPSIKELCSNTFVQSHLERLPAYLPRPDANSWAALSTPPLCVIPSPPVVPRTCSTEQFPLSDFQLQDSQVRSLALMHRVRRRLLWLKMNWISAFAGFDDHGDGSLSQAALQCALMTLSLGVSNDEAAFLVQQLAPSPTDRIQFSSFSAKLADADAAPEANQLAAWAIQLLRPYSSDVAGHLRSRDFQNRGTMPATDFQAALQDLVPNIASAHLEALLLLADKAPEGEIQYMHFADAYGAPPPPPILPTGLAIPTAPVPPPCSGSSSSGIATQGFPVAPILGESEAYETCASAAILRPVPPPCSGSGSLLSAPKLSENQTFETCSSATFLPPS